jgi:phospholipid/cholesterol/gamma-HCH transport system ATP-binding protein
MATPDDVIVIRSVWKSFDVPVLTGVDLSVRRGETLAVVGPSGTGKSVLLKTTIGLVTPDRGQVWVAGVPVAGASGAALRGVRSRVGYVFQHAALFDSMTVLENVLQGFRPSVLARLSRRESARAAANALEHVNLDPATVLGKLPAELSGGMRKRVGLARAIVGLPQILLYDEPVTGLDPVNAAGIHRLIARLSRDLAATSVVVTHDVEGALAIADRIALLEGGRIRFVGSPAEFRESEDQLVGAYLDGSAGVIQHGGQR